VVKHSTCTGAGVQKIVYMTPPYYEYHILCMGVCYISILHGGTISYGGYDSTFELLPVGAGHKRVHGTGKGPHAGPISRI
jgi:hypothetical protein